MSGPKISIARIMGAALATASALAILGYVSYLFWTEVILDPDAALVLKVAIPGGAAGLAILMSSVVRERLQVRAKEGLDEVKP
jgi:hypothetical protein